MVQGDLEDDELDCHHEEGLDQQGNVESCAGVVEYPGNEESGRVYKSETSGRRLTLASTPQA